MIRCHLSPLPFPSSSPLPSAPSLPQRKPAIQSGAEIRSLGAWPGPRPLANEVGERQPKSLPLGLYCLYRGLVIGGYGSGIKRLLPQPLRRVRHSLPPSLLRSSPPLLPSHHASVLFKRKRRECPSDCVRPRFSPSSSPPSACLPPSLPVACPISYPCVCVRACVDVQVAGSLAPPTPPYAALLSGAVAVGCVVPWSSGMKPSVRACSVVLLIVVRLFFFFLISSPPLSVSRTPTRCR